MGNSYYYNRHTGTTSEYIKMGESLCRVLLLFLPIQNSKKQLLEIIQRIELTLNNDIVVNDNKIYDELNIDVDKLIEMLKESLDKEEVKEIDNDASSTDSEQERNKIMIKHKRNARENTKGNKKHKKRLAKKKNSIVKPLLKIKHFTHNKLSRNPVIIDAKRPIIYNTNPQTKKVLTTITTKKNTSKSKRAIFKQLYHETYNPYDPRSSNKCPLKSIELSFQEISLPSVKATSKQPLNRIISMYQRKPLILIKADIDEFYKRIMKASAITKKGKIRDEMLHSLNESIIVRQSRLEKKSEQEKYEGNRSKSIFVEKKIGTIIRK